MRYEKLFPCSKEVIQSPLNPSEVNKQLSGVVEETFGQPGVIPIIVDKLYRGEVNSEYFKLEKWLGGLRGAL